MYIPTELLELIFLYCTQVDLVTISLTNKKFRSLAIPKIRLSPNAVKTIIGKAAYEGYLDLMKYYRKQKTFDNTYLTLEYAAKGGHIHILEYMKHLCFTWHGAEVLSETAGSLGYLHIIQWMDLQNLVIDKTLVVKNAMLNGQTTILDYAMSQNWIAKLMTESSYLIILNLGMHQKTSQWLRKNKNIIVNDICKFDPLYRDVVVRHLDNLIKR